MPIPGTPLLPTATALSTTNTLPKNGAIYRCNGGDPVIRRYPEAASQTFDRGELVGIDSAGRVILMGTIADPAANAVGASLAAGDLILGMALNPATNGAAGATDIDVVIATDDVEFFFRVYNATRTSAQTQDVAVGDKAEPFRYGGAGISTTVRDAQTVISAAPNGTDGINKLVITDIPDAWTATGEYPGVWVKVRNTLQARGQ